MSPLIRKPLMDSELRASLNAIAFPAIDHVTSESIKALRSATATPASYLRGLVARGVSHKEVRIPSQDNSKHEIILSILQSGQESTTPRPCLFWIHGGGFHWGDRLHTFEFPEDVIFDCDAICVSVEYRLAPEHTFDTSLEDCYAGLKWTSEHTEELGIDPKRVMVGGSSAGGGLAALTVLLCRERQGPAVCAQCLICPAIDDRLVTPSALQYVETSDFLPRTAFEDIWRSCLGKDPGVSGVGIVGRARDLSDLPTSYLDVGSAELLRDEVVEYASRLWASGVQAELHVWQGGFHGFDIFLPDAAVSQALRKAKTSWVKRIFWSDDS